MRHLLIQITNLKGPSHLEKVNELAWKWCILVQKEQTWISTKFHLKYCSFFFCHKQTGYWFTFFGSIQSLIHLFFVWFNHCSIPSKKIGESIPFDSENEKKGMIHVWFSQKVIERFFFSLYLKIKINIRDSIVFVVFFLLVCNYHHMAVVLTFVDELCSLHFFFKVHESLICLIQSTLIPNEFDSIMA